MGYDNYTRTDIQTSDPRAVIVLLYEGAVRFLQKAGEALDRADRAEMSEYLLKAQKIVHFLTTSLNFEQGGPVAKNLSRLYGYLRDTLNEANIQAAPAKIQEAVALLRPLLEAWRAVAQDPAAAAALEARAAAPREARPAAAPVEFSEPVLASVYQVREAVIAHAATGGPMAAPAGAYPGRPRGITVAAAVSSEAEARAQETAPADGQRAADRKAAGRVAYGLRVLG